RVQLDDVVDGAHERDHHACGEDHPRVAGDLGNPPEEWEVRRHDERGGDAEDEGEAAHARDRNVVHVAVADGGDRANPGREPAYTAAEEVGHGSGDDEDQEILTHSEASLDLSCQRPPQPSPTLRM